MNVFVLCCGRTGSLTFSKACSYIENYTQGHETRVKYLGAERLAYPNNHIEVDNRLIWFNGSLNAKYRDDAFYVHLTRDKEAVARSYNHRWNYNYSIIDMYASSLLFRKVNDLTDDEKLSICRDYVQTVEDNIIDFLQDKSKQITIDISEADKKFPLFWEAIGAEGNLNAAIGQFQTSLNSQADIDFNAKKSRPFWRRLFK